YVNAGHIPPILISKNKDGFTRLGTGGFITGFLEEAEYETETIELESGDILAAFTDGVPEVANRSDQFYGEEAIADFIKRNNHLSAVQIAADLFQDIETFSEGKSFRDDGTLIMLKVK
ncbi:MAG TPA: PP2C family protein-serine/threonine phosphatase, partial [Candidatus Kapabacteria bacterium]|nr:PP2C family protein-serine/threonine phosphatase [Candidatus Kapabacteria bacterium]